MSPNLDATVANIMRSESEEMPVSREVLKNLAHDSWRNLDWIMFLNTVATGVLAFCAVKLFFFMSGGFRGVVTRLCSRN